MRYAYGDFFFEDGECSLDSERTNSVYTPRGSRFLINRTHSITGEIIPPHTIATAIGKQNWIANRIREIKTALAVDNVGYCGLLNDAGGLTENIFYGINSASGIKVSEGLSFGKLDQADGTTGRSFSFTVSTEEIPIGAATIFSYQDSITWEGNAGPEYAPIELDVGPPLLQQIKERTLQRILQSGTSVGIGQYPNATLPFYPALPFGAKPVITKGSPSPRGNRDTLFPISWRYVMLSDTNLFQ